MAEVLTSDNAARERLPLFAIEIGGVVHELPEVLETEDLEDIYRLLGELLCSILERLPAATLEGWDLRRHLVRVRFSLAPKPEPERDESSILSFPGTDATGHRRKACQQ